MSMQPEFEVIFARGEADLKAAQALRYDVFVTEMGANGALVDHEERLERDHFDDFSQHMLLLDRKRGTQTSEQVVGVYRLIDRAGAEAAGGFYSENEFDLSALLTSSKSLLELGRSCLHPQYRGGMAMYHLWSALARYIEEKEIDLLFGAASFAGTNRDTLAAPLALLMQSYLAPRELRPVARVPSICISEIAGEPPARKATMKQIPALIKAYLRLGGGVGQGAFLDRDFNTTDVCLVLDVSQMSDKQRKIYSRKI